MVRKGPIAGAQVNRVTLAAESAVAFRRVSIGTTSSQGASVAAVRGITLKSDSTNTSTIYVAAASADATVDGANTFLLRAGESIDLEINNLNLLFFIAGAAAQILYVGIV